MASFLSLAPALSLFVFFFFLIETHPLSLMNACGQTSHTWLLSPPLSHSLPWAFFSLVTSCHGFREPLQAKKKKKKTRGIKGGHFGDSWTRLVPVAPCPAPSHCARGDEGRHCVRIRASCVSAHYTGECRGDGWSKKSEGAK